MSPAASGRIEESAVDAIFVWSARVQPRRLEDGLARGTRVEKNIFVAVLR